MNAFTFTIHVNYFTIHYSCLRLVRGALLCSCRLFAPCFSAIDSLQECSSLFEETKGGAAFAGYAPIVLRLSLLHLQFICCIGWALVWISYRTVRGALLCSCRLFAPRFSAIDSLQECSSLFEEPKGGSAFAGYAAGRHLHIFPTSFCDCFRFVYHIRQPCYYEGLFFDVEEFSTAAVYWRLAHQSTAKHIHWEHHTW
jgi:hypothetical protein